MNSKISFSVVAISLLVGLALASVDEGAIDFSYIGANGPANWGKLKPAYSACSSGKKQSPVNIIRSDAVLNKNLKPLEGEYVPEANATLINFNFVIGLKYEGKIGGITINGKKYNFKQLHWHSPSEHLIDGQRYPAEVHLVHQAEDGSTAVVGILFQYGNSTGDSDPLVEKVEDGLHHLSKDHGTVELSHVPLGVLNTKPIARGTRKYFRYIGSFTTPPCTENVIWTVLGKVRTISKEQVAALKAPLEPAYKENARPDQQLNGRKIELFDELN